MAESILAKSLAYTAREYRDCYFMKRWSKQFAWHVWPMLIERKAVSSWVDWIESGEVEIPRKTGDSLKLDRWEGKPFHRYHAIGLNFAQRAKLLRDTYRFNQLGYLNRAKLYSLHHDDGISLGQFQTPAGTILDLRISAGFASDEADMMMILNHYESGDMIGKLLFNAWENEQARWEWRISCIQGGKNHEVQRQLEKECQGLRPRALLFFVFQELARFLQVSQLAGIRGEVQRARRKMSKARRQSSRQLFDYNQFWKEVGAKSEDEALAPFWTILPLKLEKRSIDEVKKNKKSMYRQRYEYLDRLSLEFPGIWSKALNLT